MEWSTPTLLVDLAAWEHNLTAAEVMLRGSGKQLRPHVKTHGSSALALRQLGPAAAGVTCATVGEAEAMVGAGIGDVLLANEIADAGAVARMVCLAQGSRITVAADCAESVGLLSAAAAQRGVILNVLVDIDTGLGRCGVADEGAARELALAVERAPGLRFAGIMGYEGRIRAGVPDRDRRIAAAFGLLAACKAAIEGAGLEVETVSAAGTSTLTEALREPSITEIQAGTYALMEPDLEGLGLPFRCAISIAATVISRAPGRVVLDAGRRSLGCDYGPPLPLDARGKVQSIADEHVVLRWDGELPPLGSRLYLRPSQNRTTFNLYAEAWLVDNGSVVERIPIEGRRGVR